MTFVGFCGIAGAWETHEESSETLRHWSNGAWKPLVLLRKGLSRAEVAPQVGVRRQSVSHWAKQLAEAGQSEENEAGRT